MSELYTVRRPDGKVAAQHHTRELAEREIGWHLASGRPGPFTIERIEREPDTSRWGYGSPNRFAGPWPKAKLDEFREQYGRGNLIKEIEKYFGTNAPVVSRMARKLGFGYRIDDPARFEKHNGRWTPREEELVNCMYDEATPLAEISGAHPRTQSALKARLRITAPTLSTRSKSGRFIGKRRKGRWKLISPVLEPSGIADDDSDEVRAENVES